MDRKIERPRLIDRSTMIGTCHTWKSRFFFPGALAGLALGIWPCKKQKRWALASVRTTASMVCGFKILGNHMGHWG